VTLTLEQLERVPGVGLAKAVQLKAAVELGRRVATSQSARTSVRSPRDVSTLVMEEMRFLDREQFRIVLLDAKNHVLGVRVVSVGSLSSSIVHPREIFKEAIARSSAAIILVHNHPSGDPTPSREDVEVTRRLVEAGRLLGIEVLDHVVVGDNKYVSFKEKGIC
jgi:DNA repair protein RadC